MIIRIDGRISNAPCFGERVARARLHQPVLVENEEAGERP
jgi:hypothetical protein